MKEITTRRLLEMIPHEEIINSDKADLDREIKGTSIHRTGLELAGESTSDSLSSSIVAWGTKEKTYMESIGVERTKSVISKIIQPKTPILILSVGFADYEHLNEIIEVANKNQVPVLISKDHLSEISSEIISILLQESAPSERVHGSLVIVNGVGVMIIGESGIGKSEATLELIQKGHIFVSDDSIDIYKAGSRIYGEAARLTKGLLEARGIGIINVPFIYGVKSTADGVKIELVVQIVSGDDINKLDRLGNEVLNYEVVGNSVPKIKIPAMAGRTLSSLIEAAVNVYIARKMGMDPLKEIQERRDGNGGDN